MPQFPSTSPNALPPDLERVFRPLCIDLSAARIFELRQQIVAHVALIQQAQQSSETLDVSVARRMAQIFAGLLQEYVHFSPAHLRLIVGAARYFVRSQDVQSDLGSQSGFDDDVMVLNFVLSEIGRVELRIDL